jgi:hypothetical protein
MPAHVHARIHFSEIDTFKKSSFLSNSRYFNFFMQTKVSIAKSTYEKMRQKRKEEKELLDAKDCERKETNPWERIKHLGSEKMTSESKLFCECLLNTVVATGHHGAVYAPRSSICTTEQDMHHGAVYAPRSSICTTEQYMHAASYGLLLPVPSFKTWEQLQFSSAYETIELFLDPD